MPRATAPDLSIVLSFLRLSQGWRQADLGKAAGISPNLISDYEGGRKPLSRERLKHLISFMSLPPGAIDTALAAIGTIRAQAQAPRDASGSPSETARQVESISIRSGSAMTSFSRSLLSQLTADGEALRARQSAGFLWDRLTRRTSAERRSLVLKGRKYRAWALCERIAAESIRKAPNHPREALDLAELALLVAERLPGERTLSLRFQGYAWAHVSNARRVCNDLPGPRRRSSTPGSSGRRGSRAIQDG
jgi:transcriptional regulator with XRE-family HTH domain